MGKYGILWVPKMETVRTVTRIIGWSKSLAVISSSPHFKQKNTLTGHPTTGDFGISLRSNNRTVVTCSCCRLQFVVCTRKNIRKKVSQPSPEKDGKNPTNYPHFTSVGISPHFPCFPSLYPCSMGALICGGHSSHDFHVARIPAPSSPAPLLRPPKTIPLTSSSFGTANRVHLKGKEFGTTSAWECLCCVTIDDGLLMMAYEYLWWFILYSLCWFIVFWVGLSWFTLVYCGLRWLMMVFGGSSWFLMVHDVFDSVRWFMLACDDFLMVCDGVCWFLLVYDAWWFTLAYDGLRWFVMVYMMVFHVYEMICDCLCWFICFMFYDGVGFLAMIYEGVRWYLMIYPTMICLADSFWGCKGNRHLVTFPVLEAGRRTFPFEDGSIPLAPFSEILL